MLIRVLAFLLEIIFVLLIAASLLRGWMNWLRINMRGQPGTFVMALTDWLVKPLRRTLPKALSQSAVDWASVTAAMLLALIYSMLWWWLFGAALWAGLGDVAVLVSALLGLLIFALKVLLRVVLQMCFVLVLGYAILSWVQPGSSAYVLLGRLTEPLLSRLRSIIPPIGGIDLSALVLLILLQIGLMLLA